MVVVPNIPPVFPSFPIFFGGLQVSPVAVVMEPTELWLGISGHFQVEKHGKKKTGKTGTPWNTMEKKKKKTHIIYSSSFKKPIKNLMFFVGRP